MITTFNTIDYVLFLAVLLVSALVGVYYALKERWRSKETTAEDILMGGREMGVFPVAMSLLASYMSAITVLGIPTEMYVFGVSYWLVAVAGFLTFPVTCFLFLPFFHGLNLSSAYKYLELRFCRAARYLASSLFVIQMLLYMAVVLYAPALALNEVTGFSLFGSIVAVGIVVTFYTSMGGLRAVLWTDTFQTFVVVGGLLGVVIIGSNKVGGLSKVWEISKAGGRTEFFNFDPSPFSRTTFWGVTAGSFVGQMTIYGASQTMLQRYMSIQSVRNAQLALFVSLPATTILVSLVCLSGLVIYATYHHCDPLLAGDLISRDQLLPYFVMDNLADLSGVPGIFVSCIFAAALSSISSCLNALSITVLEDLIRPSLPFDLSPRTETFLAKAIGVLNGVVVIGLALVCYYIGNTVLQIMLTALGAGGGPLLGLFILGMFFPCVNYQGAISGFVISTITVFWIAFGAIVKQVPQPTLPFSIEGCSPTQDTTASAFNEILQLYSATPVVMAKVDSNHALGKDTAGSLDFIYRLSFLWYPTFAVFVCVTVGILVSAVTGWTTANHVTVDSRLVYPVHNKLCCLLPGALRQYIGCGTLWTYNVGSTDLHQLVVDEYNDGEKIKEYKDDDDDGDNYGFSIDDKDKDDNDDDYYEDDYLEDTARNGSSSETQRLLASGGGGGVDGDGEFPLHSTRRPFNFARVFDRDFETKM